MKNQELKTEEARKMTISLVPLQIRQIEERLEVSALAPHGGIMDGNLFDGDNCCHGKCSGNDIQIDDPLDTGELFGGRGV